jgi:hypothetical protein
MTNLVALFHKSSEIFAQINAENLQMKSLLYLSLQITHTWPVSLLGDFTTSVYK